MAEKQRYPLTEAQAVAQALVSLLEPACERIEIAGSIRRARPDVGDIELLCIPKPVYYPDEVSLLTQMLEEDALDKLCRENVSLLPPRPDIKGRYTYGTQNKLLIHLPSGIPVDVFSTTPEHWGMSLVVRTGSREFNIRFMARLKQLGFAGHAYAWNGKGKRHGSISTPNGEIDCPTEDDVFRVLGWKYIEPKERT